MKHMIFSAAIFLAASTTPASAGLITNLNNSSNVASSAGRDALAVGGNSNFSNGRINGDFHVGGTPNLSGAGLNGGTLYHRSNPLNFSALGSQLSSDLQLLTNIGSTGTVFHDNSVGRGVVQSSDSILAVFNITAADLQRANHQELDFRVDPSATAVVNVSGTSASLSNFQMFLNGTSPTKILHDFADATSVDDSNASIQGTVIAPSAAVLPGYSNIKGSLYAASLIGGGELHDIPFTGGGGAIPFPVPEPTPAAFGLIGLGTLGATWYRKNRKPILAV